MTKEENQKRLERLKGIVSNMPQLPGSYQYLNSEGVIIYVGKAKNLKARVSSYFHKEVDRFKTKVLVSKIFDIKYTVVNTEADALLLENNLIKKYKPRYNILLKDGKTYPSICVTNEPFPRIFKTRVINRKWGTYYGPYSHIPSMLAVLDIIKKLYHPRTCRQPILPEGVRQGRYKACLEYHIHNCQAPCTGCQSQDDYAEKIRQAREILRGNTREVSRMLMQEMQQLASELRFEEAHEVKQRYLLLEQYCAKSEVVSHIINNVDVFSVTDGGQNAFVNYLHVTNGSINQAFTFEFKKKLDESEEEILRQGIVQIRERLGSMAKEIIVPFMPDLELEGVTFTVPQRSDRKTLLDLSVMNGRQYKFDRLKQAEKLNPEQKTVRMMKEIEQALHLPSLPLRIECFDNSNISGTNAVAGCVVFEKLKPKRSEYRKFNIKTVTGPDDYASMHEVVLRRYSRLKEEAPDRLPNLIITDGGKGQMEVVRHAVCDILGLQIPIAGLAKDSRHRTSELLYGFPPQVIGMKQDSELFHLFTRIQDEVHRYAITFHRDKRSKSALHSALDDIPGIGPKTRDLLLSHFKGVKRIREASQEQIAGVIGAAKAEKVVKHFKG